jgi:hypothetical protein
MLGVGAPARQPSVRSALGLVVDVDELSVDDVVSLLRAGPAGGTSCGGRRAAESPPALYIASASLWLAVVSLSTALLISSAEPLWLAFFVSSMAASMVAASSALILSRCSLRVFSVE